MTLNHSNLGPAFGATHRKKRLGRGPSSGKGGTSGRGNNGQNSRSGSHFQLGEQTTLLQRMPKLRGFTAVNPKKFEIVNVDALNMLASKGITEITREVLEQNGLVRVSKNSLKVLGNGEIATAIQLTANTISASAQAKIEKAGGKVELVK